MSKIKKDSVCGVVVTFNRKELLKDCLKALIEQTRPLDAILIVDNASTDNTPQILLEMGYIQQLPPEKNSEPYKTEFMSKIKNLENESIKIIYIRMNENTGGAGGFHMGQKHAFELGYDWIWLMDDDGYPDPKALEKLMEYSTLDNVSALNCLVVSNKNEEKLAFQMPYITRDGSITKFKNSKHTKNINELYEYFGGELYEWGNFFNGTMVRSSIISKVGNINKKMFIWGDEQDYFYRLRL
ncbi:glycosyltransferase, partial [Vibrio cholerae]